MEGNANQLISYIAPAAPATRRPGTGSEPFLRPEIGFTPKWFHKNLGISFNFIWHTDPQYRRETIIKMRAELRNRYPGTSIGRIDETEIPIDLLTGTYGSTNIAAIYGIPIIYSDDNWPNCEHQYLTEDEIASLIPPNLDENPNFNELMNQVNWIAENEKRVEGFINWQGVLNNAQRIRGQDIFLDMMIIPELVKHLFDCVTTTMVDAAKRLHEKQRATGVDYQFFTMSNCLVNMVSSDQYTEFLLPYDLRISNEFDIVGVHNCAWNADNYIEAYSKIPNLKYIDMGQDSNLNRAKKLTPDVRRAIMYTPMDVVNKSLEEIQNDFENIAENYGPCDIVAADIEYDTPDQRVIDLITICKNISDSRD